MIGQLSNENFKSTSDGWRGKLAKDFTFRNVEIITNAIAKYLLKDINERRIIIGYDTRFMSKEFAFFIADTMRNFGISSFIINRPSPTPILAYATNFYKFPIGINITASHNPPFDNGIKIRMNHGGCPNADVIKKIESYFGSSPAESAKEIGKIESINPFDHYFSEIKKIIKIKNKKRKLNVLVDTMHGTTLNILKSIFEDTTIRIHYLNKSFDPYFGKINPEPKFETTKKLQKIVSKRNYDFGIAHDGDGDRIIVAMPAYKYLSPHDIAAIVVLYLVKYQKNKGMVLGSSTLGRRTKKVCESLGIKYSEIPVGFKNATEIMLKDKVLLAAEENGGIGFGFYLPERDAILTAAKLVEMEMSVEGGIKKLLTEVEKIAGKSGFCRYNYKPSINRTTLFKKIIKFKGKNFNFRLIKSTSFLDGIKIFFDNDDWLSIRFSGTEDIIRIYCESDTREGAVEIKDFVINKINELER